MKTKMIVKAVVSNRNYGDDCALYEAMGYIRNSERKTGLTRNKNNSQKSPAGGKQL